MAELGTLAAARTDADVSEQIIEDALSMMRKHLGMESAVISEFIGDTIVFQAIDAPDHPDLYQKGMTWPAHDTSCKLVLDGVLPRRMPDIEQNEIARDLPIIKALSARALLCLPIFRSDGSPYGMLSFVSQVPEPGLAYRDLGAVEMFATLVEREVQRRIRGEAAITANRDAIEALIKNRAFEVFAQPITALKSRKVSGYEALCRFADFPDVAADAIFDLASSVGLRARLEAEIIIAALDGARNLPDGSYLSVNASPTTVFSPVFNTLFRDIDLSRVVLEMTEHQEVKDYAGLLSLLEPYRANGLRIAVDDAGTGYSGLHQIIRLQPDMIKLDRALVSAIDTDQAKRAMCAAMVHYAGESGAFLVAEGVETEAEANELVRLGVSHAQGYHFGRPLPLKALSAA